MTETQRRIEAYKAALPDLRERVIAVALLLVMSAAMMTSASFAWLTISRAPEVTAVSTTVAANGNLEIALAKPDGSKPAESAVGDSSAAKGQNVVAANLTWGNLVNLSDASYGLENLTLRPAQLNTTSLLDSPLYGADYGLDGRVESYIMNFVYTSWVPPTDIAEGYFGVSEEYGVRAVSSKKIMATGFRHNYEQEKAKAIIANQNSAKALVAITEDTSYKALLAKIVGIHMTAELNTEDKYRDATITQSEFVLLMDMYEDFIEAYRLEAEAIAQLLNTQLFAAYGGAENEYSKYTLENVMSIKTFEPNGDYLRDVEITRADGTTETKTLKITKLEEFIADFNTLNSDYAKMEEILAKKGNEEGEEADKIWVVDSEGTYGVKWTKGKLNLIVKNLMDVDQCRLKKTKEAESKFQTVAELMKLFEDDITKALDYNGASCNVVITNGPLYNLEQRTGGNPSIDIQNLTVTAKKEITSLNWTPEAKMYAYITTSKAAPFYYATDLDYSKKLDTGASDTSGEAMAQDTYAMAIDFWVRTNEPSSILTLEGTVNLSDPYTVDVMGKDDKGQAVPLYTWTQDLTDEDGQKYTVVTDLYKKEENGVETWYNATSHTQISEEELDGYVPNKKVEEKRDVIGYEGENRVWDDSMISGDATTQGTGSCYIYYADSPEDMARSLDLLKALEIAFIDDKGELLATAIMDTENSYLQSGRAVVPIVVDDDDGEYVSEEEYGITRLEEDVPKRITALVYLDGNKIGNENVLSAADIQGKLNIQFGSSASLQPIENEELEIAERKVSASVSPTSFDYDRATEPMTSTVTVRVDGEQPKGITAFFMRKINNQQGTREKTEMVFEPVPGSQTQWQATYTFTAPGEYVLRTIQLDGVEYDLTPKPKEGETETTETVPTVTVSGFAISSLDCIEANDKRHISVITDKNYATANLSLVFVTDDPSKMPATVEGRFMQEDGAVVNVNFKYNANGTWSGQANFTSSGEYTLQYLLLNGKHTELPENLWITASVSLGMRAEIRTSIPDSRLQYVFNPAELTEDQLYPEMTVRITDNTGREQTGLSDVKLHYTAGGSRNLDTDLVWNASRNCYVGELAIEIGGPGVWRFKSITIGEENTITYTTMSPTFTVISLEPPEYLGFNEKPNQVVPDGGAIMEVNIDNSDGVKVQAVLYNEYTDQRYEVMSERSKDAVEEGVLTWIFDLPADEKTKTQDGNWIMEEVRIWGYFDKDKLEMVEEGSAKVINLIERGENYRTKVVQTITARAIAPSGYTKEYTGTFMQEHSVSGITVTITDFAGEKVDNIILTASFEYTNVQSYGGYTYSPSPAEQKIPLTFTQSTDGTLYTQTGSVKFRPAGDYKANFQFAANGKTYTINATALDFKVTSSIPTVKITACSTYGNSTNTDTSATVYFGSSNGACGTNYSQPYVTITLSGIGSAATKAVLGFSKSSGEVLLYSSGGGSTAINNYEWTEDGACQRYVGYYKSIAMSADDKTAAGEIVASNLVITYNGINYTFDVPDITINNPS